MTAALRMEQQVLLEEQPLVGVLSFVCAVS